MPDVSLNSNRLLTVVSKSYSKEDEFDSALFKVLRNFLGDHFQTTVFYREKPYSRVHVLKGSWTRDKRTYACGIGSQVGRPNLKFTSQALGVSTSGPQDHTVVLLAKEAGQDDRKYKVLECICGVEIETERSFVLWLTSQEAQFGFVMLKHC